MKIFVTGSAGFIGFHLSKHLLCEGFQVLGYDAMTDYYEVRLKHHRHQILLQNEGFQAIEARLEEVETLKAALSEFQPEIIVHLAAQAGVRYSLENPRCYIESNLIGAFNIIEMARLYSPKHLLMASTSSVYGGNQAMPFRELDKADMPLTIYAATKKANEAMAHSYAHLWHIPTTMFRFFTVYGPWGRPDMALFKYVAAILQGREIDIYNHGEMYRDFTYVDDLVKGIRLLMDVVPPTLEARLVTDMEIEGDSLSPVAPYRVVNIGNSNKVRLLDFVAAIEDELGVKARRNLMAMQKGDVAATWADCGLLKRLTGYQPETDIKDGISAFVAWYRAYYQC